MLHFGKLKSGARPLTLAMIRRLSEGLKLPADVLIADYELRDAT